MNPEEDYFRIHKLNMGLMEANQEINKELEMKKSLNEILFEELKGMFFRENQGLTNEELDDKWQRYQCGLIKRYQYGEEK